MYELCQCKNSLGEEEYSILITTSLLGIAPAKETVKTYTKQQHPKQHKKLFDPCLMEGEKRQSKTKATSQGVGDLFEM